MLGLFTQTFTCLNKEAIALLLEFGSAYLCEQMFLHKKLILIVYCCLHTEDNSEACVQLKVPEYSLHITGLNKEKQGLGSH